MLKDGVCVIHLFTEGDYFGYKISPTKIVLNIGNTDSRANFQSSRKNGRLAKLLSSSLLKHSKNHC